MRVKSIVAAVVAFASLAAFAERETAIYRGKLTSDLNANQHSITNLPEGFFPEENDPTVPAWAKKPNPPETDLTPAINYTDSATNAVMTDLTARLDKKLDKADVINPADAEESGKAADAMATKDALDGKLDTIKLYSEEYPGSGGPSLRWIDSYQGLAFGYGSSNYFYPQIRFTDAPYGEIRHVGNVNPDRPWSWITIGDSTDENTLQDALDEKADVGDIPVISATNPTFSNAVLAVQIDTNTVAQIGELKDFFDGLPVGTVGTSIGSIILALLSAVAWLKKNKVQTLKLNDGSVSTSADGGVAKLDDFFTNSNSLLTGTIDARLPYPLNAVTDETGLLKDRAINTTNLASVTVPDNLTDLLVRASVASSLAVTMPEAIATKYGDTFPGEAGEYLITITKTGTAEAYVRTIKLEEVA